jgi:hypothetical protein
MWGMGRAVVGLPKGRIVKIKTNIRAGNGTTKGRGNGGA